MLTKESILQIHDLPVESVEVPEWGGKVHVRTMSGAERDAFELGCVRVFGRSREENLANVRARLCAYTLSDEAGQPLFDNPERDAVALGKKNCKVLDRIWTVARALNGLNKDDVEELAKNFESGPSGDSPTV